MKCYSALQRKEILTSATTWINLEYILLSEISQSQRTNDSTYKNFQDWSTRKMSVKELMLLNCDVGTLQSPFDCKEIKPVILKGNQS